MQVRDALDRIDQIHAHLARAEVYRGFRVPAVAFVGALGLLAAAVQPYLPAAARGTGFVAYWAAVAAAGALLGTAAGVRSYFVREDEFDRRRTRKVLVQMLPCVVAGGAVTAGITRSAPEFVAWLPGLWAVLFGLGVAAAAPYLPPAVRWVGFGYLAAGTTLLFRTDPAADPSGWAVGLVFGAGHFATAWALWNGEPKHGEESDGTG
jgi:hypothetical protein